MNTNSDVCPNMGSLFVGCLDIICLIIVHHYTKLFRLLLYAINFRAYVPDVEADDAIDVT